MARKKNLRNDAAPKILRNYDPYSMEQRIYNLEQGGVSPTPGGSWDYSTDEVSTNQKWIDGKTIYCKVIEYDSPITHSSGWSTLLTAEQLTTIGVDSVIDAFVYSDTYHSTSRGMTGIDSGGFKMTFTTGIVITKLTIFYTKTSEV